MTHLDLEENQLFTKLDLDRTIFKISLLYMAFSVSHQKVLNFYCQNSSLLLIVAKKMEFSFWLTKFWSIQSCPLCIWKKNAKNEFVQAHSQKFFEPGEVSCKRGTSTNVLCTNTKTFAFFLRNALKTAF